MIRFQRKPDRVFTAILHEALETELDQIRELIGGGPEDWSAMSPRLPRCFTPQTAAAAIEQLLAASRDAAVYQITDYHWLILYECLRAYCQWHNDIAAEQPERLLPVGEFRIGEIDFDDVVDLYFWDTDFLFDPLTLERLGPEARQSLTISDEAFAIAQGLQPHPDELRMERWEEPEWEEGEAEELFRPGSRRYPDWEEG